MTITNPIGTTRTPTRPTTGPIIALTGALAGTLAVAAVLQPQVAREALVPMAAEPDLPVRRRGRADRLAAADVAAAILPTGTPPACSPSSASAYRRRSSPSRWCSSSPARILPLRRPAGRLRISGCSRGASPFPNLDRSSRIAWTSTSS